MVDHTKTCTRARSYTRAHAKDRAHTRPYTRAQTRTRARARTRDCEKDCTKAQHRTSVLKQDNGWYVQILETVQVTLVDQIQTDIGITPCTTPSSSYGACSHALLRSSSWLCLCSYLWLYNNTRARARTRACTRDCEKDRTKAQHRTSMLKQDNIWYVQVLETVQVTLVDQTLTNIGITPCTQSSSSNGACSHTP